jgi:rhodanese-related sulfurtransferase
MKAKLGSPDVVLLDVRFKDDWESSNEKITGAVRMDPQTVYAWSSTLPKDKEIVLY